LWVVTEVSVKVVVLAAVTNEVMVEAAATDDVDWPETVRVDVA